MMCQSFMFVHTQRGESGMRLKKINDLHAAASFRDIILSKSVESTNTIGVADEKNVSARVPQHDVFLAGSNRCPLNVRAVEHCSCLFAFFSRFLVPFPLFFLVVFYLWRNCISMFLGRRTI